MLKYIIEGNHPILKRIDWTATSAKELSEKTTELLVAGYEVTTKLHSDYRCKKCGTELEYRQIQGIRIKNEKNGKFYYVVYCPKCKGYFESEV